MAAENILQTMQRVVTTVHRVDELAENTRDFKAAANARLDRLETQQSELRERVARIEAGRDADRAQMQANLARFQAEVERAELRLSRLLPPSADAGGR